MLGKILPVHVIVNFPKNLTTQKDTFDLCRLKNMQNSLTGKKYVEICDVYRISFVDSL